MSKVYVAAPWKHKDKMPDIAEKVEQAGHTITHKWWLSEDAPEAERGSKELRRQAERDVKGVKSADVVLLINSAKSEGKSLEQGIAVADRKPIIAEGKLGEFSKNVFHYLSLYTWVATVEESIDEL